MQLIGQSIKHVTFGKGVVTDWNGNVITVCFSAGEKKFIYPDAFSNFLILKTPTPRRRSSTGWTSVRRNGKPN